MRRELFPMKPPSRTHLLIKYSRVELCQLTPKREGKPPIPMHSNDGTRTCRPPAIPSSSLNVALKLVQCCSHMQCKSYRCLRIYVPIGNSNEFAIIYTHGQLQTNDQVSTLLFFVFCVNLPLSYKSEKIWKRKEDAKSRSLIAPAHGEHRYPNCMIVRGLGPCSQWYYWYSYLE